MTVIPTYGGPKRSGLAASEHPDPVWGNTRTTASHTIGLSHLAELLAAAPANASLNEYSALIVDENVLGRATEAGRRRVLRHLRELYSLDDGYPAFHALRVLWTEDDHARPLLAGSLAYSRDAFLRSSFNAVKERRVGERVTPADLSCAVHAAYPHALSDLTLGKVGRNTASSWQQIGHLVGKTNKVRARVQIRPVATAYALLLGHLSGLRGGLVLDSPWTSLLDTTPEHLRMMAHEASRLGYLDFRSAGGVDELDFSRLFRNEAG